MKRKHEKARAQLKLNHEAILSQQKAKMLLQLYVLIENKAKVMGGEEHEVCLLLGGDWC